MKSLFLIDFFYVMQCRFHAVLILPSWKNRCASKGSSNSASGCLKMHPKVPSNASTTDSCVNPLSVMMPTKMIKRIWWGTWLICGWNRKSRNWSARYLFTYDQASLIWGKKLKMVFFPIFSFRNSPYLAFFTPFSRFFHTHSSLLRILWLVSEQFQSNFRAVLEQF